MCTSKMPSDGVNWFVGIREITDPSKFVGGVSRTLFFIRSLFQALYRSIDNSVKLEHLLSPVPQSVPVPVLLSLCFALSSVASLHLYGDLGCGKLVGLLEYRSSDPLILRSTRLQIFNQMAEEQPDSAIDCLRDIQLGLKVRKEDMYYHDDSFIIL